MLLKIVIEPDDDMFTAYCPQLPGCVTYGENQEEAFDNIKEAVHLYLRPIPGLFNKLSDDARILEVAV